MVVSGLGFGVEGLELRVWDLCFRFGALGFRVVLGAGLLEFRLGLRVCVCVCVCVFLGFAVQCSLNPKLLNP